MKATVRDNPAESRYEVAEDGTLAAVSVYRLGGDVISFVHTETEPAFAGRGLASELVRQALDDVRRRGLSVRPFCPFVRAYIARHPAYRDLVPPAERARFGLADAPDPADPR